MSKKEKVLKILVIIFLLISIVSIIIQLFFHKEDKTFLNICLLSNMFACILNVTENKYFHDRIATEEFEKAKKKNKKKKKNDK